MRSCSHHRGNSFPCHEKLMAPFKEMKSGHWGKPSWKTASSLLHLSKVLCSVIKVLRWGAATRRERARCIHMILISNLSPAPLWDFIGHVRLKWRSEGTIRHVTVSDHCRISSRCLLPRLEGAARRPNCRGGTARHGAAFYKALSDGPSSALMHQEALNLLFVAFHYWWSPEVWTCVEALIRLGRF